MLASILTFTRSAGYPLLLVLVMAESAGVPIPGETALIAAAALAGAGKLSIAAVIAVAASAAIIGDNIGFLLARRYGPRLLQHPGPFLADRTRALELGEPFFARHGPKAVFFARWILGLRTWAAWLAGASKMHWKPFVIWNAAGGISWATTIGLVAYFVGQSSAGLFTIFGLVALVVVLSGGGLLLARGRLRRNAGITSRSSPPPARAREPAAPSPPPVRRPR
jgi:membrane protein DedA with SNARE-associated domain